MGSIQEFTPRETLPIHPPDLKPGFTVHAVPLSVSDGENTSTSTDTTTTAFPASGSTTTAPAHNNVNNVHVSVNESESNSESSILYTRLSTSPPKIVRAAGNYLYTDSGQAIFDATGGAAVACLGHNDARIKAAIDRQLGSGVAYTYAPFFTTDAAEMLATQLKESTGGEMTRTFVVSSGTEAVEAGLKMARQYFLELPTPQPQRTKFIARYMSYHGNTLGSLSVGYHAARRANYEPIIATNVTHVSPCYPYRNMKAGESEDDYVARLAEELDAKFCEVGSDTICAFVAETFAGLTLGCAPPLPGYLRAMKDVCDKHGALFMLDEVMSGMGRTGTLHAWQHDSVVPDLQTVAKGLGAGYLPIGALLMNRRVVDVLAHGTGSFVHSQTYQGHPVACAAAYEVQRIIGEEDLLQNVRTLGKKLENLLGQRLGEHKNVGDIRGRGFFWGIELVKNKSTKEPFPVGDKVSGRIHATGLQSEFGISLMPGAGHVDGRNGDVIVLAPAYNITEKDVDFIVEKTAAVIERVLGR